MFILCVNLCVYSVHFVIFSLQNLFFLYFYRYFSDKMLCNSKKSSTFAGNFLFAEIFMYNKQFKV